MGELRWDKRSLQENCCKQGKPGQHTLLSEGILSVTIDNATFSDAFRDPDIARALVRDIEQAAVAPMRLMEVCGTHTMAIFRHGIRGLLPPTITLLSGPGCPVCVTDTLDINAFIALSQQDGVTVATFGDLMRVPGSFTSLRQEVAEGADVRVVYSAMDAVELAQRHPDRTVVFLGVGFETTAPTVAAAVLTARDRGVTNFCVYSAHKVVPPALDALMAAPDTRIDGFLLPGHVSVIIGTEAYRPFFQQFGKPCVVAGFEPLDILEAVRRLARQITSGRPQLSNAYSRAVSDMGNPLARRVMETVFAPCDARWRGLGVIPGSGLAIRPELAAFDAARRFNIAVVEMPEPKGCLCGPVLTGARQPTDCPLFGKRCTPMDPVGPCMVSNEGSCAAFYRYFT
ncbi:MAG: hydrogenase formation protein HypD [Desulfatitalea sp.]|nr:hydrogenase formation protein HypD [Desulfatitalea sp.]